MATAILLYETEAETDAVLAVISVFTRVLNMHFDVGGNIGVNRNLKQLRGKLVEAPGKYIGCCLIIEVDIQQIFFKNNGNTIAKVWGVCIESNKKSKSS